MEINSPDAALACTAGSPVLPEARCGDEREPINDDGVTVRLKPDRRRAKVPGSQDAPDSPYSGGAGA
jgi:hypothetical protein